MDLVNRLQQAHVGSASHIMLIDRLWGDRPEVLDAIRDAHRRGVSTKSIARMLSEEHPVSDSAVANWLQKNAS